MGMKGLRSKSAFRLLLVLSWLLGGALFPGASAGERKPLAFPEMTGWRQDGKPQIFSPRTLYEYINGAADLYLTYEFQDLSVAEYKGEGKAAVTVEVYRHGSPTQAFGIYSQERLANARFLDIGAQGYQEPNVLNFVAGPYYVKINGYSTGTEDERVMLAFGRKMGETLGGKSSLPQILSSFPREGMKKNTEKFISKNFLGYSYLHSGYTADYEVDGKKFKIFVIEGQDAGDCRGMMESYLKQTGNEGKSVSEGPYRLKDRYHGDVDLFWKGKWIWGIVDLNDPEIRSKFLKAFEDPGKR
jgi:hypothetical protein